MSRDIGDGWGGFGSNGSVHWKIVHTGEETHGGFVRGRDPNIAVEHPSYSNPVTRQPRLACRDAPLGGVCRQSGAQPGTRDVHDDQGYGIADVHVPGVERPKEPADNTYEIVTKW